MKITAETARELAKQSYETNKLLMVPYIEIIKNMIKCEAKRGKFSIIITFDSNDNLPYMTNINGHGKILVDEFKSLGFRTFRPVIHCGHRLFIGWDRKVLEEAMKS